VKLDKLDGFGFNVRIVMDLIDNDVTRADTCGKTEDKGQQKEDRETKCMIRESSFES
jgi:hypothetical protein